MFDSLSDRLVGVLDRLRGSGRLSEKEVDEALREIRLALLEADVNFKVVKGFVERVRERCVGADLRKSLTPGQQVIKIVHEELISSLGGETLKIHFASKPPTVVLLAGLQGSGKTTTAAKLALWFKKQGRHPMLVAADLQRPAAIDQLHVLAEKVGVPVYSERPSDVAGLTTIGLAQRGLKEAVRLGRDVLIIDTAGRIAVDEELMDEVAAVSRAVIPHYTFLVLDSMTGQDAVNTAEAFHQKLALDGVIFTKLDGDTRGGAILSVKDTVGRPIAFAAMGEKLEDLEAFHPDRIASRILGQGDVLTLIEKAEAAYDEDQAQKAADRLMRGQLTLEDFLEQLQQIRKMGPLGQIMGMLPGLPKELKKTQIDDREVGRVEAIVRSMTPEERQNPAIIDGSRRRRIALGSGTTTTEVNRLLNQFKEMQKMMKTMGKGAKGKRSLASMSGGLPDLFGG